MNFVLVPLMQDVIAQFVVGLVRILAGIVISLVLSAGALYSGMGLLDRLTQGIDEWKEMRKGNAAVALFFAAAMISMMILVGPRIYDLAYMVQSGILLLPSSAIVLTPPQLAVAVLFGLANYLAGLLLAIVLIFLSINIVDRITPDLEELAELKKGNLGVAIILAVAVVLIVFAASQPVESLFSMIKSLESAFI